MSKISVITINYNDVVGLEKTILSVINQTPNDFEFIIIDGNSSDGSKEILEKYKEKFTYWVSENDSGIYNAMNKGINVASGDYLLFMNSGDVLVNDENILKVCQEKLIEDIIAFDCYLEKESKIQEIRTHIESPTLYYVYKYGLKHQSTFIKRDLFQKIGLYNENYKIASDYEFWIRCLLNSKTTVRSHKIPIAIFALNGISQNGSWGEEHKKIENEFLPHLIDDFKVLDRLMPFQYSRFLKKMIFIQNFLKKKNCIDDRAKENPFMFGNATRSYKNGSCLSLLKKK